MNLLVFATNNRPYISSSKIGSLVGKRRKGWGGRNRWNEKRERVKSIAK
jgi:hypothetical protein